MHVVFTDQVSQERSGYLLIQKVCSIQASAFAFRAACPADASSLEQLQLQPVIRGAIWRRRKVVVELMVNFGGVELKLVGIVHQYHFSTKRVGLIALADQQPHRAIRRRLTHRLKQWRFRSTG